MPGALFRSTTDIIGSAIAEIVRAVGLSNADVEALETELAGSPAEPMPLE